MTQSGVSQHIRDLERSLGRSYSCAAGGGNVDAERPALFDYSQRILRLAAEAKSAVADAANLEGGQVLVEATPGVSIYVLSEQVHAFASSTRS